MESPITHVLRLPELLENILIHIPKAPKLVTPTIAAQCAKSGRPLPEDELLREEMEQPIFQLFVLKRVNTTFKSVIEGSRTCRQLMQLELVSSSVEGRLDMTKWLLSDLALHVHENRHKPGELGVNGRGHLIICGQLRDTLTYFARQSAWRELKWNDGASPSIVERYQIAHGTRAPNGDFPLGDHETGEEDGRSEKDIVYMSFPTFKNTADLGALLDWVLATQSTQAQQSRTINRPPTTVFPDPSGTPQLHNVARGKATKCEEQSASTRVFNIAELLENMLIHVPKPCKAMSTRWQSPPLEQPLYQLSTLKHTSITFKAVTEDSKTCRQLMHLESINDSPAAQYDLVLWLCYDLQWCSASYTSSLTYIPQRPPPPPTGPPLGSPPAVTRPWVPRMPPSVQNARREHNSRLQRPIRIDKKLRDTAVYFSKLGTWRRITMISSREYYEDVTVDFRRSLNWQNMGKSLDDLLTKRSKIDKVEDERMAKALAGFVLAWCERKELKGGLMKKLEEIERRE